MQRRLRNIVACAATAMALGCGSSSSGGKGGFKDDLQGNWATCQPSDATSQQVSLAIVGLAATIVIRDYATSDCSGTATDVNTTAGTLKIGDPVPVELGSRTVTAYQMDETAVGLGTQYDLGFVDTTVTPHRLYLGDTSQTNDGSTPALRPTELDSSNFFVKQ